MIHISIFSGIGGFEIAAEMVGWTNAASCEINDFGNKVLQYHFPNTYHHRDVKTLTYKIINEELTKRFGSNWRAGGVILSGGFPCQGFSVAGLRAGTDDDRYLWPEYLRLIEEINPDWVCGENVTGILTMEDKSGIYRDVFAKVENRKITRFDQIDYYEAIYTRQSKMLVNSICEDLEKRGFEVQPFAIPAASVEAPHKRERIWFVAHCISNRSFRRSPHSNREEKGQERPVIHKQTTGFSSIEYATETQSEWRSLSGLFTSPGYSFTSDTNIDDARGYRYGQTGQAPRIGKVIKEERQRLRTVIERIGGKEHVAYSGKQGLSSTKQEKSTGAVGPGKRGTIKQLFTSQNGGRGLFDNFPTQSPVCGGDDGLPSELDGITFSKWRNESIKGFGNAVVWQVVFEIFSAIDQYERSSGHE